MHKKYCADISYYENLGNSYPISDVSDVIMRTRALFEIQSHNVFYFLKNHFQINEFVKSGFFFKSSMRTELRPTFYIHKFNKEFYSVSVIIKKKFWIL